MLYCHGNGGNVANWADAAQSLHDRVGVSVLLFDYRGYGRSEGKPSEVGVLADARAARAWLAQREGIAEKPDRSDGAITGRRGRRRFGRRDGARALVLESTFTSLPEVAQTMFPLLPVRLVMQTKLQLGWRRSPTTTAHCCKATARPTDLIPYRIGRELFDAANEPKQFVPHCRRRPQRSTTRRILPNVVGVLGSSVTGTTWPSHCPSFSSGLPLCVKSGRPPATGCLPRPNRR